MLYYSYSKVSIEINFFLIKNKHLITKMIIWVMIRRYLFYSQVRESLKSELEICFNHANCTDPIWYYFLEIHNFYSYFWNIINKK